MYLLHNNLRNWAILWKRDVKFGTVDVMGIVVSIFTRVIQGGGGRTRFADFWIFVRFSIGLHWVLLIHLFKFRKLGILCIKYENPKSDGEQPCTPL